ncbi:MAG: hypothetical protein J7L45_03340 [Candidatus Aenigmarchaeota archaeon]|nr:hypothetical protein [Candidatus Aenigmarchaeota archaeon]
MESYRKCPKCGSPMRMFEYGDKIYYVCTNKNCGYEMTNPKSLLEYGGNRGYTSSYNL